MAAALAPSEPRYVESVLERVPIMGLSRSGPWFVHLGVIAGPHGPAFVLWLSLPARHHPASSVLCGCTCALRSASAMSRNSSLSGVSESPTRAFDVGFSPSDR